MQARIRCCEKFQVVVMSTKSKCLNVFVLIQVPRLWYLIIEALRQQSFI